MAKKEYVAVGHRVCVGKWRGLKTEQVKQLRSFEIQASSRKAATNRARKRYGGRKGCRLFVFVEEV